MWGSIQYQKPGRRRPVYVGTYPPGTDIQGAVPRGWCLCCGGEVFSATEDFCLRCRRIWGGGAR